MSTATSAARVSVWRRIVASPWSAQLVVAVVLVALAAWQADARQIADSFAGVRYQWLLVALLVYIGVRFLHSLETRIVLTKVGQPPILGLFGVLLVGSLVNAVLPANLGDVAKVQIMANRYRMPRVGLVAGRGAEAVVNGIMFVVFVIIGVVLTSRQGGGSPGVQWLLAIVSSGVCLSLTVAAIRMPETLPRWSWLRQLPHRLYDTLEEHWPRLHDGFEAVRRPKLLLALLVLNVVGWVIDIAMFRAYGEAFNLDMPLGAYVSVAVVLALVTTFPITFGSVGSWEVGIIAALALYDVGTDQALAFAVGIHVFVTLFNIGLGLIAMALLGLKPGEVLRLRRTPDQTETPELAAPPAGSG